MVTGHAWPVGLHLHVGVFGTNRWRRLYLPLVELTRKLLVDAFDGTVQLHLTERYHSAYWLLADRCRVLRVELTRLTGCDVGMQWFKWKSFFWGVLLTIWVSSDAEFWTQPEYKKLYWNIEGIYLFICVSGAICLGWPVWFIHAQPNKNLHKL